MIRRDCLLDVRALAGDYLVYFLFVETTLFSTRERVLVKLRFVKQDLLGDETVNSAECRVFSPLVNPSCVRGIALGSISAAKIACIIILWYVRGGY